MICSRKRCQTPVKHGESLCPKHFEASLEKTRGALASQTAKPEGEGGCWLWTGDSKTATGYGIMGTFGITANVKTAHWVALYLDKTSGFDIHDHGEVHHTCKEPGCVNPHHLVHLKVELHELLHQLANPRVAASVLDHLLEAYPNAKNEVDALRNCLVPR